MAVPPMNLDLATTTMTSVSQHSGASVGAFPPPPTWTAPSVPVNWPVVLSIGGVVVVLSILLWRRSGNSN